MIMDHGVPSQSRVMPHRVFPIAVARVLMLRGLAAPAGEVLCGGIVLPEVWPPQVQWHAFLGESR
jgi:hypothetical protein